VDTEIASYIDKPPERCLVTTCDNSKKEVSDFVLSDRGYVCVRCETPHEQISPNFWRMVFGSVGE